MADRSGGTRLAEIRSRLESALDGRYSIGRELGRGGMATVYLAYDHKHDRDVALKVLHPDLAAVLGPERFLREIRTAARLQHPHILPVHDSGEADGLLWFTMPFVAGESLRDRLRREVQLPVEAAVAIACEVAEALDYAHRQGVVHRDVKPENVLLSQGHALVADFGIAFSVGDAEGERAGEAGALTEAGVTLGTPAYMSPEQSSGARRLDARSDVYSLGCVLYEMLAGEPPFTGANPQILVAKRLTGSVPSVRVLRPQIQPGLDAAIARALAPTAADRFPTSGALATALKARDTAEAGAARLAAQQSIAVLPFANLSPDPDNEYFADGMTDELINALAKVRGLHVVSRTSVFAFKGQQQDVRAIGARLGVGTVLEGSVRKSGSRLRLSVQLIGVADGYLLWSETFDRDTTDVFAIQDEISRAIAGELKVTLFGAQRTTLVKPATEDLEAYTLYLKGRQFWNRRSEEDIRRGLVCFEQAIARDPGYALAYAGAADSFAILGFYCMLPPTEAFPRAREAALRGLAIDSALAEAHPALAYVAMYHDWDWSAAELEFRFAITLNPGYATAHQWYGNFLSVMGRPDESLAEFSQAVALDPLSPLKLAALGWSYYFIRNYDKAIAECRRALELDDELAVAHCWVAQALEAKGEYQAALPEHEEGVRLSNRSPWTLGFLGHGYASVGRSSDARRVLEELLELRTTRYVSGYDIALVCVGLGDSDGALTWLEQAEKDRAHQMAFLKVEPRLDPLRSLPRFLQLLDRMNLGTVAVKPAAAAARLL